MPSGCNWIYGEPRGDFTIYCGAPRAPQRPYCPFHCAKAYLTPKEAARARLAAGTRATGHLLVGGKRSGVRV